MNGGPLRYDYTPHPKQAEAHSVLVDELLFGGAAGGGKSHWARAEAISFAVQVPDSRTVIFRRTFPDLQRSVEEEMKKEIPQGLATYNHSKHVWTFANGAIIELGHLQRKDDVLKYQGAQYQLCVFEEATHFTESQYLYMKSRLRAAGAVQKRMRELGLRPRIIATANPGGPGHHFIKARFVDPAPAGKIFRTTPTPDEPRPGTRCYIPSRVTDNPSVNPEYIDMLNALPETQRKALRDGDWDVLEGVRFKDWRASAHVIRPEQLPVPISTGQKVIAVDYGHAAPFAAVWLVKLTDDMVVVYREAYAKNLTPAQQAELIRDLSSDEEARSGEKIPVVCDPSMWNRSTAGAAKSLNPDKPAPGTPAHAYQQVLGRTPMKAVNARVNGWALVDEHLRIREDGLPRLLVHDHCVELIRTLPALPRDQKRPEDVDTTAEDHLADSLRYGLMYLAGKRVLTAKEQQQAADQLPVSPGARSLTAGLGQAAF
ncbi:phage terminase large subunit [Nesterenkonia sp. HG001]|uniref:phage terminase large subunit n=1 Tax=Nesterenkonia sp. HG001 TaxID=2983207 RepID=UPI002AC5CA2E|nr:phage terminase large subunit [Nesterenkonia sp. HG001]MDZ5076747.1 phage terminase large subunit [Nesterenkonia sp. HG001]